MKTLKFLTLLFLLFPLCTEAQKTKKEQKRFNADKAYYEKVLGANDPDFKLTKAPKDLVAEPVVVLSQKTYYPFNEIYDFREPLRKIVRKRILLQDKAAIESFSEFYFQQDASVWITHLKANGKEKLVKLGEAVKVEAEVPRFYADSYRSEHYLKVAIPDLEAGDILDFVRVSNDIPLLSLYEIIVISNDYPVVRQEVIIDSNKYWDVNVRNLNGAPAFQKSKLPGLDSDGDPDKKISRIVMIDENRPATKDERWTFTLLNEPLLKISIDNIRHMTKKDRKKMLETDQNIAQDMLLFMASHAIGLNRTFKKVILKRFKKINLKELPKEERVPIIYHGLRYQFLIQREGLHGSEKILRGTDYNGGLLASFFITTFSELLEDYDISSSAVVVVPRYFGELENAILMEELMYGVYVPATKKYFWIPDKYYHANDERYDRCGAKGYSLDFDKLKRPEGHFKEITIPISKPENHLSQTDLAIKVNTDNTLSMAATLVFKGKYKNDDSPILLYQTNYLDEDFELLTPAKKQAKILKKRKKQEAKKAKKANYRQRKEELGEQKTKLIERWLKRSFEVKEFEDFSLLSYGRIKKDEPLSVEARFTSDAYLKKAGSNLIFEVGKLIGSQVGLEEEEIKKRTKDIELGYARTIINNIEVTLPEGYKAQGLDNLTMNVDNANASFVSVATQEGNILTIKTTKTYKKASMPKTDWGKMVTMLEAAYKFSQQKIILKKK